MTESNPRSRSRSPKRYYDKYEEESYSKPRYSVIKGSNEERDKSKCLYVGNLPYDFRDPEVKDMFEKHGKLTSVSVPLDRSTGKNKGFAFVGFEIREDADAAKNEHNGTVVEGRKLRIDWDIGRESKDQIKRPPTNTRRDYYEEEYYRDSRTEYGYDREYEAGYYARQSYPARYARDSYPPYRRDSYDRTPYDSRDSYDRAPYADSHIDPKDGYYSPKDSYPNDYSRDYPKDSYPNDYTRDYPNDYSRDYPKGYQREVREYDRNGDRDGDRNGYRDGYRDDYDRRDYYEPRDYSNSR